MTGAGNQVAGLLLADAPVGRVYSFVTLDASLGEPGRGRGQVRLIGPAPVGHWPLSAAVRADDSQSG
jgi:hypothetical protein